MTLLNTQRRSLQYLTYATLRGMARAAGAAPLPHLPRIGDTIGRLLFAIDRAGRRRAEDGLRQVDGMPEQRDEIDAMLRRTWGGMATMLLEYFLLPRLVETGEFDRRTRTHDFHHFANALAGGRGAIVVGAHQMSWEWAGLCIAKAGFAVSSVARPVPNPWLHRDVAQCRAITGQKVISSNEPLAALVAALRRNELLIMLADQDAGNTGMAVPFFGRPAWTAYGPAVLAVRHRVPIVMMEYWRDDAHVYHVRAHEPLDPARFEKGHAGVQGIAAAYTARIEEFVRRHPDQWRWWWLPQRWRDAERRAAAQPSRVGVTCPHAPASPVPALPIPSPPVASPPVASPGQTSPLAEQPSVA